MRGVPCLVLAVVMLMSSAGGRLEAQAPVDPTVYAIAYVGVAGSAASQVVGAFKQYRDASRTQAGYVRFELFEQVGRPGQFVVAEAWRDQSAVDAHVNTPHAMRFRDTLQPLRSTGYDERPYKTFTVALATGTAGSGAIHVVTHLDTVGGPQAGGPDLVRKLAEASRREAGCVRFDVLQHAMRANHFTVIETWASQAAFDAHGAAPHTKQYREAVQPVTGSPLDERVYRAVE
jgi:quinol monooxygenase YgiN